MAYEFDQSLNEMLANKQSCVQDAVKGIINMGPIHVSTLTIAYKTDVQWNIKAFDLKTLNSIIEGLVMAGFAITSATLSGTGNTPPTKFKNAVFLKTHEVLYDGSRRRKCFMLFQNGKIQLKGARNATEGENMCRAIVKAVSGSDRHISDVSVVLINTCFSTKRYINLDALHAYVTSIGFVSEFDVEKHSAVNITINYGEERKDLKIMVFQKGNVIMTGASTPDHLLTCYAFVANILKKSHEAGQSVIGGTVTERVPEAPKKRGRKRKADKEALYDLLDL